VPHLVTDRKLHICGPNYDIFTENCKNVTFPFQTKEASSLITRCMEVSLQLKTAVNKGFVIEVTFK
jgi:hypothetical protein